MQKRKNIYFIGPLNSTFVKNDISILSENYDIKCENLSIGRGIKGLINLCKLSIKAVYNMLSADIFFGWFADYTTFFPVIISKIFRKKSVIIAGGFDVLHIPEMNIGAKANKFRWFCVNNSFRFCDKIIAVSNYAKYNLDLVTSRNNDNAVMIHNCIVTENFPDFSDKARREIHLTVSQADSEMEYIRKGNRLFIQAAKGNPNSKFVLAGLKGAALTAAIRDGKDVSNLEIIPGPLDLYQDIIPLYQRAFSYFQQSTEETFGVAVIEAMMCGAVPIISSNGALTEVTGGLALIDEGNIEQLILKAENTSSSERRALRAFAEKYDIKQRAEKLTAEIRNL